MGKKSRRRTSSIEKERRAPSGSGTGRAAAVRGLAALLILVGAATLVYSLRRPVTARQPTVTASSSARPFYENPEDARPFPATLDPSQFGIPFVARAYAIARGIPEVLVQQPCDCNCGVLGHRSLLDCYASTHAANCTACLKEALFAEQGTIAGSTPEEIRADIDEELWRDIDLDAPAP